jgi:hypothetical protein
MVWVVADGLGVDYGSWVRLYQSKHFQDEFPEDNKRFQNVTYTDDVGHDREKSLLLMRERMFSDFKFTTAVFIGGMGGIVQESDLILKLQPNVTLLPVTSTGGAVHEVAQRLGKIPVDLGDDMDYVALFHRHLGVSVKENRYRSAAEQPPAVADRLWQRAAAGSRTP